MRRLAGILFGMIVGGAGVWTAFNYHVVRGPKEWVFVPKRQPTLTDVYVDIRQWRADDWRGHTELIRSLVAYGRGDLVVGGATRGLFDELLEPFRPRTGQSNERTVPR